MIQARDDRVAIDPEIDERDDDKFEKFREDQLVWTLTKGNGHNPIFSSGGSTYKQGDGERDIQVKNFLGKMKLSSLFDLEYIAGDRGLSQADCELILSGYDPVNDNVITPTCEGGERKYSGIRKPFTISLFDLTENYLYLSVFANYGMLQGSIASKVFDIRTGEVLDVDPNLEGGVGKLHDGVMWFSLHGKVTHSYNLDAREYVSYEGRTHNKSQKWWITNEDDNFTVESLDGRRVVNLGKLENQDFASHDYVKSAVYFETNQDGTKFAVVNRIECGEDNFSDCALVIRYGDMVENGLSESETISVKLRFIETACWPDGNTSFFWDDSKIITTSGCPVSAELAVFDTETGEFLYRHGEARRGYLKIEGHN